MSIFTVTLILATFLCSLVAGFVFAFAVVVMPGLRDLGDGEFLRAFQLMDRVIQRNQPLFMVVWIGSVVALVAAAVLGYGQLDGNGRALLIGAVVVYLLGVQLPTAVINIPLNNRVQKLVIHEMSADAHVVARREFESRWNLSNSIRTFLASVACVLLLVLLLRVG